MSTINMYFRGLAVCFWIAILGAPSFLAAAEPSRLERLKYNHPGLEVDLSVGLWAVPLPMDYDSDGDLDLIVSCADVPYNGTYYFENPGSTSSAAVPEYLPVFKPARRIAEGLENVQVSLIDGTVRVTTPATEYPKFREQQFSEPAQLPLPADFHGAKCISNQSNQWKYCDYDDDGALDLVIGIEDWAEYGWDNAYNEKGEWTNGPLHGYIYLARNVGTNERPEYEDPVKLQAGDQEIDLFGSPSPNLADFDGDGDLDLLCGEFVDSFTYFENRGTRSNPRFQAGRKLTCDGEVLRADLCMIVPVVVDWDRDGYMDLVVGQEDGRVMLIRHSGSVVDGLPQFERPRFFRQQADDLKFGALTTPVGFDWDDDGDEDILCGNTAGEIGFIENLDGGMPPKWAAPKLLEADGKPIRIQAGANGSIQGPCESKWGYTTISVADWDHDGLPDIIANSIWGKVVWFRNVGTRKEPRLSSSQPVDVAWPGDTPKPPWVWWEPQGRELVTHWRTTPVVVDFDDDGLNDLVMLDRDGYLALYRRKQNGDSPILLPPERVIFDERGGPFRLTEGAAGASGRRKLCLADWDGDGRLDLFVNAENAQLFKGLGWNDGKYTLRKMGPIDSRRLAGHSTSPTTVDWDQDGVLDLLIGAEDGCFYYLQNSRE
jgi:hypothetical protein